MRNSPLTNVSRFASLLFVGIFAGFQVTVLVLETSLRGYGGTVYAQVRQIELDLLDTLASVTLIPAMIATAVLVFLAVRVKGRELWLPLTALALMLLVLVVSVTINVPINSDQLEWNVQAPPSDWADVRDTWQSSHVVRVVAAVLAFGCLTASAMSRSVAARVPGRAAPDAEPVPTRTGEGAA